MPAARSRRLLSLLAVLLVLSGCGGVYQLLAERADLARHPPPGRWVDADGLRLQLHCIGEGRPTVMLEAGLGNGITHWAALQPQLAEHTRVCAYDRAGLGWSEAGSFPRDADRIAREFAALVEASGESGPFVLVGHSNGGLYARLFAYRQPEAVAGLVLLDPNHEDGPQCELPAFSRWTYGPLVQTAPLGLPRLLLPLLFPLGSSPLPPEAREAFAALRARSVALRSTWSELGQTCANYATLKAERQPLGELPLVVLSAGRRPPEAGDFVALHARLAQGSTRGEHRVAEGVGHFLQLESPALAADAVLRVLAMVRADAGQAPPPAPGSD
jgi:pimeloyl-ACP methyl ester carboxylesterase